MYRQYKTDVDDYVCIYYVGECCLRWKKKRKQKWTGGAIKLIYVLFMVETVSRNSSEYYYCGKNLALQFSPFQILDWYRRKMSFYLFTFFFPFSFSLFILRFLSCKNDYVLLIPTHRTLLLYGIHRYNFILLNKYKTIRHYVVNVNAHKGEHHLSFFVYLLIHS